MSSPTTGAAKNRESKSNPIDAVVSVFHSRLVRRDVLKNGQDPQVDECCDSLRKEVDRIYNDAKAGKVMKAAEWETLCQDFSQTWCKICHELCPHRFMTTVKEKFDIEVLFDQDPEKLIKKRMGPKENKQPAQPYFCVHCSVVCNSELQIKDHLKGMKHQEMIRQENARGRVMPEVSAISMYGVKASEPAIGASTPPPATTVGHPTPMLTQPAMMAFVPSIPSMTPLPTVAPFQSVTPDLAVTHVPSSPQFTAPQYSPTPQQYYYLQPVHHQIVPQAMPVAQNVRPPLPGNG
eukprot:Sspe_Gene.75235::Locus_47014_Transcript_1_1_Confidence_1.000_Length_1163::g.75235::m.75235